MRCIEFTASIVRTLVFLPFALLFSFAAINLIRLTSLNFRHIGNLPSRLIRRCWGYAILSSAGTWLKVENADLLDSPEPVVLMTNHGGEFDIPAALALFRGELRIIAKAQLEKMWFVGDYLRHGHFFLSRETNARAAIRQDLETLNRAAKYAAQYRVSLLVFPEGTRSPDGKLKPFKQGAFHAAIEAGLVIQPVALLGTHRLLPKGSRRLRGFGPIRAVVCHRVPTAGRHWKEIAEDVRKALLAAGCSE